MRSFLFLMFVAMGLMWWETFQPAVWHWLAAGAAVLAALASFVRSRRSSL